MHAPSARASWCKAKGATAGGRRVRLLPTLRHRGHGQVIAAWSSWHAPAPARLSSAGSSSAAADRMPCLATAHAQIKKGQVIAYVEQLGTHWPVESPHVRGCGGLGARRAAHEFVLQQGAPHPQCIS